jgi:hypothetical protein
MMMMSGERRSAYHVFPCERCRDVVSIEIALGEPSGAPPCEFCGAPVDVSSQREIRLSTMRGLALGPHGCPRCGAAALAFTEAGKFL